MRMANGVWLDAMGRPAPLDWDSWDFVTAVDRPHITRADPVDPEYPWRCLLCPTKRLETLWSVGQHCRTEQHARRAEEHEAVAARRAEAAARAPGRAWGDLQPGHHDPVGHPVPNADDWHSWDHVPDGDKPYIDDINDPDYPWQCVLCPEKRLETLWSVWQHCRTAQHVKRVGWQRPVGP